MRATGKYCKCCEEYKPLTEFHRNRKQPDGYQTYCIDCNKVYKKTGKFPFARQGSC